MLGCGPRGTAEERLACARSDRLVLGDAGKRPSGFHRPRAASIVAKSLPEEGRARPERPVTDGQGIPLSPPLSQHPPSAGESRAPSSLELPSPEPAESSSCTPAGRTRTLIVWECELKDLEF